MEDQENELFDSEAELAMEYNQNLGFGIGLFQAGTNMFLNRYILHMFTLVTFLL